MKYFIQHSRTAPDTGQELDKHHLLLLVLVLILVLVFLVP